MRSPQKFPILVATAILTVVCASAQTAGQTPDPYNPQTQRNPTVNAKIDPNLLDLGTGTDQGNIGPFITNTDKEYARAMAVRGIMEIRLGQTALEKTEREDVKAVAQRMIRDYLNWNDGMSKAAARLHIELPADLDAKQKAEVDRVAALSGAAFDQAYLKEVIRLQQKALTMSHLEANPAESSVSGFRHYAGIVVPVLQDQIRNAQRALEGNPIVSSK
jgi:putative membrane protein